jgi:hypothetical protein
MLVEILKGDVTLLLGKFQKLADLLLKESLCFGGIGGCCPGE